MAGIELATAYVSLVPSLQGAQGAIANEFNGVGDEAGGIFSGAFAGTFLGNIASGLFEQAGRAIGTLLGTGFSEAAEAEVANAQLTAAITSTGNAANVSVGELNALASSIQGYSGQTDDSIAATQGLLLRFQNIKNVGVDDIFNQATVAAADMAARLGGDAASQATKLGRALDDPISGLTLLARSGVNFTEQQKAQVEAMVAAGDVLGAQKIILAGVNAAYGGSAAAFGGTWTGTVERVKRAFEDFTQGALQGLLPIFTPIANGVVAALQSMAPAAERVGAALSSGIGNAIEAIAPIFGQIASTVGPLVGQFVELWMAASPLAIIFGALQPILPQLLSVFGQLAATIGGALGAALQLLMPVVAQLAATLAGALGMAMQALLPVIVQVAGVLGPVFATVLQALVPIIIVLAGIFSTLVDAILPLLVPIIGLIAPIAELIGALLPPLVQLFAALLGPILELISPLLDLLVPAITIVIGVLTTIIGFVVEVITWFVKLVTGSEDAGQQLDSVWSGVLSFFGGIWDGIVGFFRDGIDNALEFVTGLKDTVVNVLRNAGTWLLDSGKAIIQGFIDGISSMIGAVGDAIGGVMDFVGGFFPNSPAERGPFSGRGWTQLKESGLAIADQFALGITAGTDQAASALNALRVPTVTAPTFDPYAPDAFEDSDVRAALRGVDPTDLSDASIEKLARALAAQLRNQGRNGGMTDG